MTFLHLNIYAWSRSQHIQARWPFCTEKFMCVPFHHTTSSLAQFSTFKHDDLSALKTFVHGPPGKHPPGQTPTLSHCMLGYTAPAPLHVGIYTPSVDRRNDTCLWKYYLPTTRSTVTDGRSKNVVIISKIPYLAVLIKWRTQKLYCLSLFQTE